MTLTKDSQESYKFLIKSRSDLDTWSKNYDLAIENSIDPRAVRLFEIYFQLQIFIVDMLEVSFLLKSNDPESFSTKSTIRLAILRTLEMTYVVGQLYKRLLEIANEIGCPSKGDKFKDASKEFKQDRKKLEELSNIRHTAGHYFSDSNEFIKSVRSVDVELSARLVASAINFVGALHDFAGEILTKFEADMASHR